MPFLYFFININFVLDKGYILAEGKAEGKTEIATNLLKKDYSIDEIVEITGLAKEKIEKLK